MYESCQRQSCRPSQCLLDFACWLREKRKVCLLLVHEFECKINKIISALALQVSSDYDKHERVGSSLYTACEIRKAIAHRCDITLRNDVENVMIRQCAQTTSDWAFSAIFLECCADNANTESCK